MGWVQVPTGLKLILRCLLSGLPSLLQGWYSSMVVNLSVKDMIRLCGASQLLFDLV